MAQPNVGANIPAPWGTHLGLEAVSVPISGAFSRLDAACPRMTVNFGWSMRRASHGERRSDATWFGAVDGLPRCEPWSWNIYLHNWVIFGVNVGKYSMHGASGVGDLQVNLLRSDRKIIYVQAFPLDESFGDPPFSWKPPLLSSVSHASSRDVKLMSRVSNSPQLAWFGCYVHVQPPSNVGNMPGTVAAWSNRDFRRKTMSIRSPHSSSPHSQPCLRRCRGRVGSDFYRWTRMESSDNSVKQG